MEGSEFSERRTSLCIGGLAMTKRIGCSETVSRYLGFLENQYKMSSFFQEKVDVEGIENPTYVYSYYNQHGCFTLLQIAQRNEWECYWSKSFTEDIDSLLSVRIRQKDFCNKSVFTTRGFLRVVAQYIQKNILHEGCFWGIKVE